jgi:hypothetical protein
MKHYLINSSVDWCDEFDMPFYELLDENMYRIYMYAKLRLGSAFTTKGFGSNEAWEYEICQGREYGLDLLQFEPVELSDIEYSIIKDHMPIGTLDIYDDLLEYLEDKALLEDSEDIYEMTPEQVMKIIDGIAK